MRAAIIASFLAAAAFAQDTTAEVSAAPSQTGDAFPQTSFLTQTDSRGVITGQPAPNTETPSQPAVNTEIPSQPSVQTSVGIPASIPAVGTGLHTILVPGTAGPNSTATLIVSANNSTTVVVSATSASGSGKQTGTGKVTGTGTESGATGTESGASGTASGTGSQSTGAAATMRAVAGSVVGVGAFMAAFL